MCDGVVDSHTRNGRRQAVRKWVREHVAGDYEVWYCSKQCRDRMHALIGHLERAWRDVRDSGVEPEGECIVCSVPLWPDLNQKVGAIAFCTPRCAGAYDRVADGKVREHNKELIQKFQEDRVLERFLERVKQDPAMQMKVAEAVAGVRFDSFTEQGSDGDTSEACPEPPPAGPETPAAPAQTD